MLGLGNNLKRCIAQDILNVACVSINAAMKALAAGVQSRRRATCAQQTAGVIILGQDYYERGVGPT